MERNTVLFVIVIAAIGVLILAMAFLVLLFGSLSGPQKRLLPDSALAEPMLESPEGKAFLARYPDSETYVFQDFNMPDCCDVDLAYYNNTETQIPRIVLYTHVNVSADLKKITLDDELRLACFSYVEGQTEAWAVRGDIVQNLRPENRDCWDIGPPPPPSDSELIRKAENTTVAKVYLDRYPDNTVSVKRNATASNLPEVTFTPTTSEPIKLIVYFEGLDWEIPFIAIACSNGNQTWYHYWPDEADFWSYLQPEQGDCWDYPPQE